MYNYTIFALQDESIESIVKEPPRLKESSIKVEEDTEISDLSEDDEEAPLLKRLKRDSENTSSSNEPFTIPAKKKFQKVPSKSMSLPTATIPKGKLVFVK